MKVRVDFEVDSEYVVMAMADSARDAAAELPAQVRTIIAMTRRDAKQAVRASLRAYGLLSHPDDHAEVLLRTARERAKRWAL